MVILQGSLRHFPPGQLLPFLGRHHHSGVLDVDAKGRRSLLFVRDGAVVWGESSAGNDVVAIVAVLLGEQEGVFTFHEGLELPANATPTPFLIDSLLEEAQRRALITRTFPDEARFCVVEAPQSQEISLKPEQFKLLFRIGTGHTFGELMAGSGATREDLAASIRALAGNGLVVRIDQDGQSTAASGEPSAATPPRTEQPAATKPEPPTAVTDTTGHAVRKPVKTRSEPLKTLSKSAKPHQKKRAGALTTSGPEASVYPLLVDTCTIGRVPDNDIVLANASVSSKHARISRTAEGFTIEDLGSRNGTFVNGEPVKQIVALNDNDMVRLGKVILTFNLAAPFKPGETTKTKLGRS
jgi:hypothetical protein